LRQLCCGHLHCGHGVRVLCGLWKLRDGHLLHRRFIHLHGMRCRQVCCDDGAQPVHLLRRRLLRRHHQRFPMFFLRCRHVQQHCGFIGRLCLQELRTRLLLRHQHAGMHRLCGGHFCEPRCIGCLLHELRGGLLLARQSLRMHGLLHGTLHQHRGRVCVHGMCGRQVRGLHGEHGMLLVRRATTSPSLAPPSATSVLRAPSTVSLARHSSLSVATASLACTPSTAPPSARTARRVTTSARRARTLAASASQACIQARRDPPSAPTAQRAPTCQHLLQPVTASVAPVPLASTPPRAPTTAPIVLRASTVALLARRLLRAASRARRACTPTSETPCASLALLGVTRQRRDRQLARSARAA